MLSAHILAAAFDALPEPIFVLDPERRCQFANNAFFEFFGLTQGDVRAIATERFWPDIAGVNLDVEELCCDLKIEGGEVFTVKFALQSLPEGAKLFRVLAGTSRSDAPANFHTQRLQTLGMLAGGVAHDFNNVLAGILGHITYLKTILPTKGPHVESLRAIEDGAKKATGITGQILNFSKLNVAEEMHKVELRDLIMRTLSLLRGAISPEYNLEQKLAVNPLYVLAVEGKLAQVVVNLVINARDAVRSGGHITVEVGDCRDEARLQRAFGTPELACKQYVFLSVKDDGHGMTQEIMSRIFEPYFSTKKEKGTGLGLATVATIVRQFGGAIEVQSQIDLGTEIAVYLPALEVKVQEAAKTEAIPRLPTGTERILVVDDESPVRNVLAVSLQHLGYRVETAASGPEALEIFQASHGEFGLVLLDMLMPQLSGEKVFFKLKELRPEVRVLLISGYTSEEAVQNVLKNGGFGFIQKPFTIEELAKNVRRCLDQPGALGEIGSKAP